MVESLSGCFTLQYNHVIMYWFRQVTSSIDQSYISYFDNVNKGDLY